MKKHDSLSSCVSHVSVLLRILISGALDLFATVGGKKRCLENCVISACFLQLNGKIMIMKKLLYG